MLFSLFLFTKIEPMQHVNHQMKLVLIQKKKIEKSNKKKSN
jgi:hypothetical protein